MCPDNYPPSSSNSTVKLPHFIAYALHRTKLLDPPSVTSVTLVPLQGLKVRFPTAPGSSGHRLFVSDSESAFMLASQVIYDDNIKYLDWELNVNHIDITLREFKEMITLPPAANPFAATSNIFDIILSAVSIATQTGILPCPKSLNGIHDPLRFRLNYPRYAFTTIFPVDTSIVGHPTRHRGPHCQDHLGIVIVTSCPTPLISSASTPSTSVYRTSLGTVSGIHRHPKFPSTSPASSASPPTPASRISLPRSSRHHHHDKPPDSLDQFCINSTNERIQNFTCQRIFTSTRQRVSLSLVKLSRPKRTPRTRTPSSPRAARQANACPVIAP